MNVREFVEISRELREPHGEYVELNDYYLGQMLDHAVAAHAQAGVIPRGNTYIGNVPNNTALGFTYDGYAFQLNLESENDGADITRLSYFTSNPNRYYRAESVDIRFRPYYSDEPWDYPYDAVSEGLERSRKKPIETFRMTNIGIMVLSSFISSSVERGSFRRTTRNYLRKS